MPVRRMASRLICPIALMVAIAGPVSAQVPAACSDQLHELVEARARTYAATQTLNPELLRQLTKNAVITTTIDFLYVALDESDAASDLIDWLIGQP